MKLDLKNLKEKDLNSKLEDLYKELMKVKSKLVTGTPLAKGQGNIKNIKKNIARIKTKLTEVKNKK